MPVVAQILIEMSDTGQIEVKATDSVAQNRVLGYGMLSVAHDSIKQLNEEAVARIQPATAAERLALMQGGKK